MIIPIDIFYSHDLISIFMKVPTGFIRYDIAERKSKRTKCNIKVTAALLGHPRRFIIVA